MHCAKTILAAGLIARAYSQSIGPILSGLNGLTTTAESLVALTNTINIGNGNSVATDCIDLINDLIVAAKDETAMLPSGPSAKRDPNFIGSPVARALDSRQSGALSAADQSQLTSAFKTFALTHSKAMSVLVSKKDDIVLPPVFAQVEKVLAAEQAVLAVLVATLLAAAPTTLPAATEYKSLTDASMTHAVKAYSIMTSG